MCSKYYVGVCDDCIWLMGLQWGMRWCQLPRRNRGCCDGVVMPNCEIDKCLGGWCPRQDWALMKKVCVGGLDEHGAEMEKYNNFLWMYVYYSWNVCLRRKERSRGTYKHIHISIKWVGFMDISFNFNWNIISSK